MTQHSSIFTSKFRLMAGGCALAAAVSLNPKGFASAAASPSATTELVTFAATGTAKGKVLTHDGKPAEKVQIVVYKSNFGSQIGGGGRALSTAAQPSRGTEVAKTVTDGNGEFRISKPLEEGTYRIEAGKRETGFRGRSLRIKGGEETEIELKLAPPRQGRGGGGGGADNGGGHRAR